MPGYKSQKKKRGKPRRAAWTSSRTGRGSSGSRSSGRRSSGRRSSGRRSSGSRSSGRRSSGRRSSGRGSSSSSGDTPVRQSALGKAKSAPTQRKSRRRRSRSRRTRSAPTEGSSRRSSIEKRAMGLVPPKKGYPELLIRYLEAKRRQEQGTHLNRNTYSTYPIDRNTMDHLKNIGNKLEDQHRNTVAERRAILEKPLSSIGFGDIPYLQGRDDPDPILSQLNCKARGRYCESDPELWKKCNVKEIHDKYILPCKIDAIEARITQKIKKICDSDDLSYERRYPFLMEQNVISYLNRYLNKDELELECRVYFKVEKHEMFDHIPVKKRLALVKEEEMETWGKMWEPQQFLSAVDKYIRVDWVKEFIGEDRVKEMIKDHQTEYEEGSLTWWTEVLDCKLVPFIPEGESRVVSDDDRFRRSLFKFLLNMEYSFLEIFSGEKFTENNWFVYEKTTDTYGGKIIDTYGKIPKVKEVLRWFKHISVKQEVEKGLNDMKKDFVSRAATRFRVPELEMYEYFEAFIDLLNFANNPRLSEFEDELKESQICEKVKKLKVKSEIEE
uniref:Uncharacterized protein n=1 Tax=viral metagenome TaxID=1070528 RepID=A0A6C0L002_9ZZZZ